MLSQPGSVEAIAGSDLATEAFQVLPEGELVVKHDSKVS